MIKKMIFLLLVMIFGSDQSFSMLSDCGCKKELTGEKDQPNTKKLLDELIAIRGELAAQMDQIVRQQPKLDKWEKDTVDLAEASRDFLGGAKKIKRTIEFRYFLSWAMVIVSTVGGGYLLWKFRENLLSKINKLLGKESKDLTTKDIQELELIMSLD